VVVPESIGPITLCQVALLVLVQVRKEFIEQLFSQIEPCDYVELIDPFLELLEHQFFAVPRYDIIAMFDGREMA
jgi:hypothetical protein